MKAVFTLLLTLTLIIGVWIVFVIHPLLPFVSSPNNEGVQGHSNQEDTPGAQWVKGIVRYIDLTTGTVLLQTEEGTMELFAAPQVLLSLTEGETVSVYIAADELATTVAI